MVRRARMVGMSDRVAYGASTQVVVGLIALSAVFAGFAYAEGAPAGRLLLGAAALLCLVEGVRCALVRPVLAADERGVEIALATRRVGVPWARIERIGGDVTRRRGAIARSVQVDVGETIYTVAAYRLGAPVPDVLSALEAARPPR